MKHPVVLTLEFGDDHLPEDVGGGHGPGLHGHGGHLGPDGLSVQVHVGHAVDRELLSGLHGVDGADGDEDGQQEQQEVGEAVAQVRQ